MELHKKIADMKKYSLHLNGFQKNLTSNIEQNRSNPSLLGYSRCLSKASAPAHAPYLRPVGNLLRQISQTKSPGAILNMFLHGPKGGGQAARNKFHSLHKISGLTR